MSDTICECQICLCERKNNARFDAVEEKLDRMDGALKLLAISLQSLHNKLRALAIMS
jgi:hypothetical protein